jgi:hypothetical protein
MGVAVTEVNRPSRWQYFAGIAIIIITSAIAIVIAVSGVMSLLRPNIHVAVPCENQSVTLNKTGSYLLFCEEQGAGNSSCDAISDMDINLYDSASHSVELSYPSSDIHYTINDKSYSSLFEFKIDSPGTYTLDAHYAAGKSGPNAVIAISSFNFTGAFIAAFFIGTIGFIIGLIIIIRASVKRRSVGRRAGATPVDKFWC